MHKLNKKLINQVHNDDRHNEPMSELLDGTNYCNYICVMCVSVCALLPEIQSLYTTLVIFGVRYMCNSQVNDPGRRAYTTEFAVANTV